jgi:Bacterial Ig domain/PKD domain
MRSAADGSKRRFRVVRVVGTTLIVCAVLLGVPLASVGPDSADAGLSGPIPANEFGDPTDEFTVANALFVYVNSDIRGGEVCIVPGDVTNPSGMDCSSAAWGGKNTVVGLGLTYALVAGPPLKKGPWRLLSTDSEGSGGQLSPQFTVSACPPGRCDSTIASSVVAAAKAAAERNLNGALATCLTTSAVPLREALAIVRGQTLNSGSPALDYSSGKIFSADLVLAGGLLFLPIPTLENPGEEKAWAILRELSCSLKSMYSDIASDPPDSNYGTVATPQFSTIPALASGVQDDIARTFDRQRGFGVALLHALERYQGALADSSTAGIALQANALDQNATALIAEIRGAATALRTYASQLDSDPEFAGPVLTAEERSALTATYARVKADGFTPAELAQLEDLDYSPDEIASIRSHFEIDASAFPTTETVQQVFRQLATTLEGGIGAWDLLARSAAAAADSVAAGGGNRPPVATDDTLSTPPETAASLDVLANDSDPDGDSLTLTSSTQGANGSVNCGSSGGCTYTPNGGFNGTDTFTYTVSDGKGGTAVGTVRVTVALSPLLVDFTPPSSIIPEGGSGSFTPHVSGAVFPVTVRWEVDSPGGTVSTQSGSSATLITAARSLVLPQDGEIPVTLTVSDAAGRSQARTRSVQVSNVAPSVSVSACSLVQGLAVHALAGTEFTPCILFTFDPGSDDQPASVLRCNVSWGDGTPTSTGGCPSSAPTHVYAASGTFRFTVTATDTDGASTSRFVDVVVVKQQTFVNVIITGRDGTGTRVVARAWQRLHTDLGWVPLPNAPLTIDFGTQTRTLVTDAEGTVASSFDGTASAVSARFAETPTRGGASDDDDVPGSGLPPGDVVFLIDESGSMGPIQQGIRQNVSLIGTRLRAAIDAQFGLVGFGALQPTTHGDPHAQRPLSDDLSQLDAGLGELRTAGVFEPGYDAVAFAVDNLMGFRPGAGVCAVLIGDAAALSKNVSHSEALAALEARHATLFAVVDPTIAQGYVDLAVATGGSAFDIRTFAANPQPLLTAILDKCAQAVVGDTDDPPTAVADTATTTQGSGPVAIDVLANDTDTDGGPKRVESVSQPSNGTAAVGANGANITYQPTSGYCNGGSPTDEFTYTLNGGSSATVSMTVTCASAPPVLSVTPADVSLQYSDPLDTSATSSGAQPIVVTATDKDTAGTQLSLSIRETGGCTTASGLPGDLQLVVGTGSGSGTTANPGTRSATIMGIANAAPGVYRRCVQVSDGTHFDSADIAVTITRESARATYTGGMFAFTPTGGGSSSVLLRATIQDSNALDTADQSYDDEPGDIRNARVTFLVDGSPRCADVTVSLVGADARTGTAQCGVSLTEGAHTVQAEITRYYEGGLLEPAVVEIARPDGSFVTGGGFMTSSASSGSFEADDGSRLNLGFNVKHKNFKNLQGHVNIVFRRTVGGVRRTFQIKANSMESLVARLRAPSGATCSGPSSSTCHGIAEFRSKATLTDVTDSASPVSAGGNLALHMTFTDKGEPGSSDTIAVTLWRENTLLFSSNWNGAKTVEQVLAGGNLAVH